MVAGLNPGVIYEMRVIASNGELGNNLQETSSKIQRIRLGIKRGDYHSRCTFDHVSKITKLCVDKVLFTVTNQT